MRGRSVPADELDQHLAAGIGWVPANHALTPLGGLAEPNPFGSVGDLRLLGDPATRARVGAGPRGEEPLEMLLCDIVEIDGSPWSCCPREFLRAALRELAAQLGATCLVSFEHEFLLLPLVAGLPFSLQAMRACEPFAVEVMSALAEAGAEPERFFAEFAPGQFEIPLAAAGGLRAADRAVIAREVIRETARRLGRRASFTPLADPAQAGNGVHIHLSLSGPSGEALLHDPARPGQLSELGASFAAGILRHARALSALCAPSPVSGERLRPHHWSAGAAGLGLRNREALLRVPPLVELGGAPAAAQMRLEYRGADATANPHLALGALIRAGLAGVRDGLDAPELLEVDPARLSPAEAERFGVGALPATLAQALAALEADDEVLGWLGEPLAEAHLSLKRAELAATEGLDLAATCRLYADAY